MPAKVKKQGQKWRVVGPNGKPETQNGSPVDGGGHNSRQEALDQAQAINIRQQKESSNG